MKLTVLQEDLLKGLTNVSRFVSSRAQLPVLSNILLSVEKGKLTLSATNLETGISLEVGAKVEKEGKTTVPAKMLVELVSNIPAGKVTLEENSGQLAISAGQFKAQLSTIPASEFPAIPKSGGESFSLSREVLNKLSSQVAYAASIDEGRPALTGILLLFAKDKLQAVATDGFRLSFLELPFKEGSPPAGGPKEDKVLLPARLVEELARILGGEDKVGISIAKKEGQILFSGDSVTLAGRLLEGDFPDFEKVMPNSTNYKTRVGKEDLARAVRAASVFAREAASVVRIKVEDGGMRVGAESQQYGKEEAVIDAKTEGGEVETAFNYRYLLDYLASVSGEEVAFETEGPTSPGLFQDPKDASYKHLIMPVRLQN